MNRLGFAGLGRRGGRSLALVAFGGAVGFVFAAWVGRPASGRDEVHGAMATGVKAPLEAVIHCPLAFAGVHLQKDDPRESRVAYHFCKPVNDHLNQCVLYDGTGPDARLIGIEYLVDDATYQAMPAEEKAFWHDHVHEVDAGLLKSITQKGTEEKATLAKVRTLWGKVYHTWVNGDSYPSGPAKLFWSVTGKAPLTLPAGAKLPPELAGH